jgi:choline dehydrogenase
MIDAGEFDYVIPGGGTAGCVVAARLTEDPGVTVCLVEAGPSDVDDPHVLRLEDWMYLLDSGPPQAPRAARMSWPSQAGRGDLR